MSKIKLKMTCGACPEQYDAFYKNELVGYLRLRHGYFYASYPDVSGKVVYESYPDGDGIFEDDEREKHLKKACKKIYKAMKKDQATQESL